MKVYLLRVTNPKNSQNKRMCKLLLLSVSQALAQHLNVLILISLSYEMNVKLA